MKKKLRHLVVDGQTYLWRFSPGYAATGDPVDPWQCHDVFTAYLFQVKASPLQVHFRTWEDPVVGGPLRTGLPLILGESAPDVPALNLHTPAHAAQIIRLALKTGWRPEQQGPFVIEDGVAWLRKNVPFQKSMEE